MQQLRALVTVSGRTSKVIAAQLNVSPSLLSKFLSGERLPDRSTVEALVQACEVTDEVRAQLLRLPTAALAEAHPQLIARSTVLRFL
ncbi:helix-turn-helix domain-containing protein [Streptomyces sp. ISL-10]|uniref:helix-turn-helix domain-containing protein n=1 Tax=Streptomyces sp. ISL-10 TaxID=2819172 RepID=UPI001BEA579C|nr:helix-turn-helix transcriptional regulator [Streptomyces sp. ISL-10]MBT2369948.1 helix-turn-helix domain-containing protein [Streptomyces sp. ISL-10]